MKPHHANLLNSITLIVMSLWAYFSSNEPSLTAFIPAFFGVALWILNKGVRIEDKVLSHVAVVLTVVLLGALFKPLAGVVGRGDSLGIFRVVLMMATTLLALAFFVKSFVDARRRRAYKNKSEVAL
ncbi:MAG: hypothetical protein QM786_15560 [Breznakibacter sp.]